MFHEIGVNVFLTLGANWDVTQRIYCAKLLCPQTLVVSISISAYIFINPRLPNKKTKQSFTNTIKYCSAQTVRSLHPCLPSTALWYRIFIFPMPVSQTLVYGAQHCPGPTTTLYTVVKRTLYVASAEIYRPINHGMSFPGYRWFKAGSSSFCI